MRCGWRNISARADASAWRDAASARRTATHVFLVGFPRSGTTLLDQVLASHPDVQTMEERDLPDGFGRRILRLRCTASTGWRRCPRPNWSTGARAIGSAWPKAATIPSKPVFVDKMPLNAVFLPLIAKLFPAARILFALRDPRDVVLSLLPPPALP